jgi:hypothetical protein
MSISRLAAARSSPEPLPNARLALEELSKCNFFCGY